MKTITIQITVPDGVEVAVSGPGGPLPGPAASTPVCPKHGAEKVAPSKFGGWYCKAADDDEPKGYCSWKAK